MFAICNLDSGYTFTEQRFVPVRAVKCGQHFIGPIRAVSHATAALKSSGRVEPEGVGSGKFPH